MCDVISLLFLRALMAGTPAGTGIYFKCYTDLEHAYLAGDFA